MINFITNGSKLRWPPVSLLVPGDNQPTPSQAGVKTTCERAGPLLCPDLVWNSQRSRRHSHNLGAKRTKHCKRWKGKVKRVCQTQMKEITVCYRTSRTNRWRNLLVGALPLPKNYPGLTAIQIKYIIRELFKQESCKYMYM